MNLSKIARNKWVWIGGAAVAAFVGYSYYASAQAASASASNATGALNAVPYSNVPYYGGGYSAVSGGSGVNSSNPLLNSGSSLSYLQSLIDQQNTAATQNYNLAMAQNSTQFQLGQQSIASQQAVAAMNANATNNASLVGAYNTAVQAIQSGYGQISGSGTLGNPSIPGSQSSLNLNVVGIANTRQGGLTPNERNAPLVSGATNGIPTIALPTGGQVANYQAGGAFWNKVGPALSGG
jgi:hypothetical protein